MGNISVVVAFGALAVGIVLLAEVVRDLWLMYKANREMRAKSRREYIFGGRRGRG